MLPVGQRIPCDLLVGGGVDVDEGDEGRSPPVAPGDMALTTRGPAPVVVVIDPASIVIRSPAPGLVADPRPPVRRTPAPLAVAVRGPVVIVIDDGRRGTPDPAVITRVDPIAVSVQFLCAPDVRVVVTLARLVAQALGQLALATPPVPVGGGGRGVDLPVAFVLTLCDQLGAASVAQCEA